MNSLKGGEGMKDPLNFLHEPDHFSSLIVGWNADAGKLGEVVIDYLIGKLGGQYFSDIDPIDFFPMNGIAIEDDLIQFPESKFYICPQAHLVMIKSTPPEHNWYKFFNQVLDISEKQSQVRDIYIVGGMLSLLPHTVPRQLFGTFSSFETKEQFNNFELDSRMNYETPPGQKPTLNSYFLWTARRRNYSGVSLWMQVPFYLMSVNDPDAQKQVLEFFNRRFHLELDLSEFDSIANKQNQALSEVRHRFPDVNDYIMRLESNQRLSEEENLRLVKQVEEFLKQNQDH